MKQKQKILVTGGAGYIGSVLCGLLLDCDYEVICADRFFFGEHTVAAYESNPGFRVIRADIRTLKPEIFQDVYAVIDLAGLSNDPACDLSENLTTNINFNGAVHTATLARQAGVARYIYASSCSVYGKASEMPVKETSACNPVSLYAKCKLDVEKSLVKLANKDFCVTFPRFATVYGASPRMRFDLIINIMTMFAHTQRKITVLGGGQQWRPVVHIRDVAVMIKNILSAPVETVNKEIFNIGSNAQNYRVIEVARALQELIPGIDVDIAPDDADKRSYNVDFTKITKIFDFVPQFDITTGAREVLELMRSGGADPTDIRTSTSKYYKYLFDAEQTLSSIRLDGKII